MVTLGKYILRETVRCAIDELASKKNIIEKKKKKSQNSKRRRA